MGDIDAADTAERQEIVTAILADLSNRGVVEVSVDASIVTADGRHMVLDFDGLVRDLRDMSARDRPDHINTRLDAVLTARPWGEVRPLLRPVLRPAPYSALIRGQGGVPWVRPLFAFVHELVAIDTDDVRIIVMQHDTRAWGVTAEQLFTAARDNLAKLYPVLPRERRQSVQFDEHGFPDTALLVPGWLASFGAPGGPHGASGATGRKTRPLAFLPGDNMLVIGSDDPEWVQWYYEFADGIYRRVQRPLSPQGFTVADDGQLVPFEDAGPHPSRRSAITARTTVACAQYGTQSAWLEQLYREAGVDVYVAHATGLKTPEGPVTCTIWGDFRIYELPEVDYVFFLEGATGDRFLVPFSVVVELTGIQPTPGFFPPRYRVAGWPEPGVMAALRRHAVQR